MNFPFKEKKNEEHLIRTFSIDTPTTELTWHRDREDRVVEVINGGGWKFQMDDELPQDLKEGDIISIPKNTYHRVIKGESELIVKITENYE